MQKIAICCVTTIYKTQNIVSSFVEFYSTPYPRRVFDPPLHCKLKILPEAGEGVHPEGDGGSGRNTKNSTYKTI